MITLSRLTCVVCILAYFSTECLGFNFYPLSAQCSRHWTLLQAHGSESPTNQTASLFPLLPPSRMDSEAFGSKTDPNTLTLGGDSQPVAFVAQAKFELQYTCNICETRNSHQVSRLGMFIYLLLFSSQKNDELIQHWNYLFVL
jgi:hypothetical protein